MTKVEMIIIIIIIKVDTHSFLHVKNMDTH